MRFSSWEVSPRASTYSARCRYVSKSVFCTLSGTVGIVSGLPHVLTRVFSAAAGTVQVAHSRHRATRRLRHGHRARRGAVRVGSAAPCIECDCATIIHAKGGSGAALLHPYPPIAPFVDIPHTRSGQIACGERGLAQETSLYPGERRRGRDMRKQASASPTMLEVDAD